MVSSGYTKFNTIQIVPNGTLAFIIVEYSFNYMYMIVGTFNIARHKY